MEKNNLPFSLLSKEIQFFQQNFKQVGIIFVLVLLISFLFPGGETLQYSYKINDITREPIIAPFTFPILKTFENYEKDKKEEKKSVAYIFNRNQEVVNNQLSLIETIDKISFVMTNTDGFADKARNVQQELEATDSVDKTSKNANNTYEEMENDMVTLSTDLKEFYDQIFDDNKKLVEKPFKPDYSFSIEYQDEGQYYSRFMNAMYQKILNDKDTVILKLLNDRLGNINKWDRYVNNLVDDLQRNYEKVQRKTERELDRFSKRSSVRKFNDYSPFTKEKERIFYYINVPKENINSVRDGYFNELYSGLNKGTAESYNGKVTFN